MNCDDNNSDEQQQQHDFTSLSLKSFLMHEEEMRTTIDNNGDYQVKDHSILYISFYRMNTTN